MEFLSAQTTDKLWPVNLVLHSVVSQKFGGDASLTPSYKVVNLPFRPSDGLHEFRFGMLAHFFLRRKRAAKSLQTGVRASSVSMPTAICC